MNININRAFIIITTLIQSSHLQDIAPQCGQICKNNQLCQKACERPHNAETTSNISHVSCGISSFGPEVDDAANRILNGHTTELHKYPWMVSIQMDTGEMSRIPIWKDLMKKVMESSTDRFLQVCGGALITPRYVLTAAHCVTKSYEAAFGINNLNRTKSKAQVIKFEKIIIHKGMFLLKLILGFDWTHDIALVKLRQDVNLTMLDNKFVVNTICLPKHQAEITEPHARLSGWGMTSFNNTPESNPYDLQDAEYLVITKKACKTIFEDTVKYKITNSPDTIDVDMARIRQFLNNDTFQEYFANQFCILASVPPGVGYRKYSNTPYKGDSGSSLFQYYGDRAHTIGLVSNGPMPQLNVPVGLFTKVSLYVDWIRDNIKD